jgi:hypothetical protein
MSVYTPNLKNALPFFKDADEFGNDLSSIFYFFEKWSP